MHSSGLACAQLLEADQAATYRTLRLFAHGTWGDYQGEACARVFAESHLGSSQALARADRYILTVTCWPVAGAQDQYLSLSPAQQLKLRQLTLVSMAASSKVILLMLLSMLSQVSLYACRIDLEMHMHMLTLH